MGSTLDEIGWLIFRFTFGALMALNHGFGKVFGGSIDKFASGVADLGFPFPKFFAWAAALSEFAGGIMVALGLGTRIGATFVGFTMLVASYRHLGDPWSRREMALLYLAAMIAIALIGPGRYSLDSSLKLRFPIAPK